MKDKSKVRLLKPEHYDEKLEAGTEITVPNAEYLEALYNAGAVEDLDAPRAKANKAEAE